MSDEETRVILVRLERQLTRIETAMGLVEGEVPAVVPLQVPDELEERHGAFVQRFRSRARERTG